MKELSIEQKSKRYDEAIHRAKLALDCCDSASQITKNVVYDIFPELKENEDEGIRKEIISALKCANHKGVYDKHIAWLERQCEQKQAHKYEPMFKVGDWVVTDKNGVVQIKAIKNDNYVLENASKFSVYYVDKCWKKWGISDAKDGDVLYSLDSNQPFIYKERNIYEQATAYCGINKYGKFFVWNAKDCIITLDKYIPATKEQRDALMKAMADAGYEWDAEKKELVKTELHNSYKLEPNFDFSVGQWIVVPIAKKVFLITKIEGFGITLVDIDGDEYVFGVDSLKNARLWTVADAKEGDVLSNGKMIVLFKHFEEPSYKQHIVAYIGLDAIGAIQITDDAWYLGIGKTHPATKEQRELLFQKMKKAGYEWDAENKELKKIEPKFKAGNWYQCTKDIFGKGVTFDKNTAYYCAKEGCLQNEYGCHIAIVKDLYDNFKLWTIEDAKDGDVLASKDGDDILIFRKLDSSTSFSSYYNIRRKKELGWVNRSFTPAVKEQRDLLFQKMREAGYEWDMDKKGLKKIENNLAWSEEDDYNLQCMIAKAVKDIQNGNVGRNQELIDWLKSLKERVSCEAICTTAKEWSEEDIKALNRISTILVDASEVKNWWKEYRLIEREEMKRLTDFLKSLKDRVQPQKQWKPSEEQLEFLKKCIESYNEVSFPTEFRVFRTLYNDLKKLTE